MKNLGIGLCAVALAAVVAGGCSKDGSENDGIDLTAQAKNAAALAGYDRIGSGDVLHVYTWCDYIAPDVLSSFERALGVKIMVDTFDSNEAMYAKLKAGGTGYDIIMPSSYQVEMMAKEGMILPIDHKKASNVHKNFDHNFDSQIIDPKFTYSVPYAVTYTGFAYLKNKIPTGVDVNSWKVLNNPAFKGRVTLLDDIREVIGGGLMSLGYSVNSTNPKEIDEAVNVVLKWRANVRKFDGESYKTEVPGGVTWVGHGYSTDSTQVIVGDDEAGVPARDDIGFALPREGYSIAFDEMVISRDSKQQTLAYAFINYIYEGEVAAANMDYICGPNPVKPGIELLDPEFRKLIILDAETIKRGQVLKNFDVKSGVLELYNKAWDRIKATEAR